MSMVRRTALAATVSATVIGVLAGAPAAQATVTPNGFTPVISCNVVSGSTAYAPGLQTSRTRVTAATVAASVSGCTDFLQGNALPGTGALHANLSGSSSFGAVIESGAFVITWPSFYNPSTGSLTLRGPAADGSYTVSGSITGGAFVGSIVSMTAFVTATNPDATGTADHPLTSQQWLASVPLVLKRNIG